MKGIWIGMAILGGLGLVAIGLRIGAARMNARMIETLHAAPEGEEAARVMLLTLPSGRTLPVNYRREGERVYAAADFPWWRELPAEGGPGSVWIRGETRQGRIRAVLDDPRLRDEVFAQLRPTAPRYFGTLVVVELE
ncbi:hypothetical protein K2X89_10935 [Myxococcota bacterium]|nr:hypothetical protein [Myxococcota bacterium]